MKFIVNRSINSIVNVDGGIYNYTIVSLPAIFTSYINCAFSITGYISSSSSSSVVADDIFSYPTILSNSSADSGNSVFSLYANINASFQYIKFFLGNNSYYCRFVIIGLYFFFIFFYFFL
jgi:hypothetical protein